jgi:hypothetical protein
MQRVKHDRQCCRGADSDKHCLPECLGRYAVIEEPSRMNFESTFNTRSGKRPEDDELTGFLIEWTRLCDGIAKILKGFCRLR